MTTDQTLLISIRPQFVRSIFMGTKTVELRRVRPRVGVGDLVVVYASGSAKGIVGAFEVAGVTDGSPEKIWKVHKAACGVRKQDFDSYFAGATVGYAIHIGRLWELEDLISLDALRLRWSGFRPPQSYHYWDRETLFSITGGPFDELDHCVSYSSAE